MQSNKLLLYWRLCRVGVHLLYGCFQLAAFFGSGTRVQRQVRIGRWSQQLLLICGTKLTVLAHTDESPTTGGRMLVANHVSWLDIFAINAVAPMRFVAKQEIRRWPVVGWLVARADTVFIRRGCRASAQSVSETVAMVLREGDRVVVFPEGTTTDGTGIKPFKSGLFQAAAKAGVAVQPLVLRYPLTGGGVNSVPAYYDDITLWQSLCAVLQQPQCEVEIHVLPPIASDGFSRQQICRLAQTQIADFLAQCGTGEGGRVDAWQQLHAYDAH